MSLPLYKKLNVLFRVEPGCLGPDGINHVEDFCKFAKKSVSNLDSDYIRWVITPRYDKNLPEMEYKVRNKALSQERATQYLDTLGKDLEDFEENLQEKLAELIDEFFGR